MSAMGQVGTGARRLGVNYALLSGGELVSKVLAAAAFAYLARVLGPQGYGQLEFTLAIVVLFTLLLDSGLSPFGARELARDERAASRLLPTILLLRGALSVVACAAVALLAVLLDRPEPARSR
jgi:O-antigen/teichoic acid export membrane protein